MWFYCWHNNNNIFTAIVHLLFSSKILPILSFTIFPTVFFLHVSCKCIKWQITLYANKSNVYSNCAINALRSNYFQNNHKNRLLKMYYPKKKNQKEQKHIEQGQRSRFFCLRKWPYFRLGFICFDIFWIGLINWSTQTTQKLDIFLLNIKQTK